MTLYNEMASEFTKNHLGYSVIAILASTCLGSIAVMTTLMHGNGSLQMLVVFITVVLCSAHNASILTLQKPKLILNLLLLSLAVNLIITIIDLFLL